MDARKTGIAVVSAANVRPMKVYWLSKGRLVVGEVNVVQGDPGLGKSTLVRRLAAAVTRGWRFAPAASTRTRRRTSGRR